jgi:DNA-binding NtrC family response regulator
MGIYIKRLRNGTKIAANRSGGARRTVSRKVAVVAKNISVEPFSIESPSMPSSSILIVDDDEPTRNGLSALLGADYQCFTAETAEEAMRLVAARAFDLLITDIHLPGASGLELCRLVRMACPGTPVVVVTGMEDIRYRIEAQKLGSLYCIEKPIDPDSFISLVQSALRSRALGRIRQSNSGPITFEPARARAS